MARIVAHYRRKRSGWLAEELRYFAEARTLSAAIRRAALATDRQGWRLDHQCRLNKRHMEEAGELLLASLGRLRGARNFDGVFRAVRDALADADGVGALYVYDTALRIAAFRGEGFYPTSVYLQTGALRGARFLLGGRLPRELPVETFPRALRRLPAHEIENVLCVYCDKFRQLAEASLASS